MKKKNQICEFNVYGKLILIDYGECFITFPENTTQEEMENIACYLKDEGFLERCLIKDY